MIIYPYHYIKCLGIQFATSTLEDLKEQISKIGQEEETVKPMEFEQEFRKLVKDQNTLIDDSHDVSEAVEKMLEDRIESFRVAWRKEKEVEIEKFKNAIDKRFDMLEKSVSNHDSRIEKVSETINSGTGASDLDRDKILKELEERCHETISQRLVLIQEQQTNSRKAEIEGYIEDFRAQMKEEQIKLGIDLRQEISCGIGKLKSEIETEISKMKEKSNHEQVEVMNVKENIVTNEIKENPVEDQFEMKMQSEMNQMKEKLKLDFSKEVQALEDEIDALRKTYDTKGYTTDEGMFLNFIFRVYFYDFTSL